MLAIGTKRNLDASERILRATAEQHGGTFGDEVAAATPTRRTPTGCPQWIGSATSPGDDHTVLSNTTFSAEALNSVQLVDWVTRLIEREQVDDVHCTDCGSD